MHWNRFKEIVDLILILNHFNNSFYWKKKNCGKATSVSNGKFVIESRLSLSMKQIKNLQIILLFILRENCSARIHNALCYTLHNRREHTQYALKKPTLADFFIENTGKYESQKNNNKKNSLLRFSFNRELVI